MRLDVLSHLLACGIGLRSREAVGQGSKERIVEETPGNLRVRMPVDHGLPRCRHVKHCGSQTGLTVNRLGVVAQGLDPERIGKAASRIHRHHARAQATTGSGDGQRS